MAESIKLSLQGEQLVDTLRIPSIWQHLPPVLFDVVSALWRDHMRDLSLVCQQQTFQISLLSLCRWSRLNTHSNPNSHLYRSLALTASTHVTLYRISTPFNKNVKTKGCHFGNLTYIRPARLMVWGAAGDSIYTFIHNSSREMGSIEIHSV